jgi:hypothetical protein
VISPTAKINRKTNSYSSTSPRQTEPSFRYAAPHPAQQAQAITALRQAGQPRSDPAEDRGADQVEAEQGPEYSPLKSEFSKSAESTEVLPLYQMVAAPSIFYRGGW